jgi:hypothetical protein
VTATEPYVVTTERFIPGPTYLDVVTANSLTVAGSTVGAPPVAYPNSTSIGSVPVGVDNTSVAYQSAVNVGAWVFDVRRYGAVGDGQSAVDGAMTSGQATLTCSTSHPFRPSDVGKAIAVKGALTSGVTTLVTTIIGYTSSSVVTLAASATLTVTGALVLWATDDTVALQNTINAAHAYGQVNGTGIVWVPPSGNGTFYGVAGPLVAGGATKANGQLVIPIQATTDRKVALWILGATDGGTTRHWEQKIPQLAGSTLVSFGAFANATAQLNAFNANGAAACISGQTGSNGYGTDALLYNNTLVRMQNIQVYTTHSLNGWGYGALNFHGLAAAALENFGYGTAATYAPFGGDYQNPNGFSAGVSIGVLLPSAGNNDNNQLRNVTCHGGYTRAIFVTEHTEWVGGTILYSWSGVCPVGNYGDGGNGVGASHGIFMDQVSIEGCNNQMEIIGPGQAGVGPMLSGSYDTEGQSTIRDNGGGLAAVCGEFHVKSNGISGPPLVGLSNDTSTPLQLICDFQFPGAVASPPALTINTAVQNPLGRYVNIVFQGNGTVTSVQVSSLMGGATAPTLTTVFSQASGALSYTARVGPLGWIKVNGTVTPPSPVWWAD